MRKSPNIVSRRTSHGNTGFTEAPHTRRLSATFQFLQTKPTEVRSAWYFNKTDISRHCKEQGLEVGAFQIETKTSNLIILSFCRAPKGNLNQYLRKIDATLKYAYNPKSEFLICGDINIDYLNENNRKKQIKSIVKRTIGHRLQILQQEFKMT
jgi:hypothetical protein